MADFPDNSVLNQVQGRRIHERLLLANAAKLIAKTSQVPVCAVSIRRLVDMIALQEGRVKRLRHQSVGTPSQTVRLRTSMKDVLLISKNSLKQIRQTAKILKISWAMLD